MSTDVQAGFKKLGPLAMALAIVGGILCAYGLFAGGEEARHHAQQGYLFGFVFWAGLAMGCLGFTLLHHTIRGAWGLSVLRLLEAGGSATTFIVFGVLAIPVLMAAFGEHPLYHWAHPEPGDLVLARKAWFLNQTGFVVRTIVYFLAWAWLAAALRKSSLKEDEDRDKRRTTFRTSLSAPMLIVFVLTTTLAATDWTMSLDSHWFSSMYGVIYLVGNGLSAIALMNIIVMKNAEKSPYREFVNPGLTKDLGNMLMVFTLLWTYMSLSQFLIIYMGNLPEFNLYYEIRSRGVWNNISLFLIFGQFLAPFVILLAPRSKSTPSLLFKIAVGIFAVRFIEQFWNVMPFMREEFSVHWMDVASLIFFGGVFFAIFAKNVQQGALIPKHDPRLKEAYQHA
jgi:hypothetical protein